MRDFLFRCDYVLDPFRIAEPENRDIYRCLSFLKRFYAVRLRSICDSRFLSRLQGPNARPPQSEILC